MQTNAGSIKRGFFLQLDSDIFQVLKTDHNYRGRGAAYVKTRLRNVKTNGVVDKNFGTDETVDIIDVDTRPLQFLYKDDSALHFMDGTTYEQYELSAQVVGSIADYLKEGQTIHVSLYDDDPLAVIPPKQVRLMVTTAQDAVKGDTATAAKKQVVVETGATISVPLFIKKGDTVAINPETGDYVERVNE